LTSGLVVKEDEVESVTDTVMRQEPSDVGETTH
jgi:hypothetical protein